MENSVKNNSYSKLEPTFFNTVSSDFTPIDNARRDTVQIDLETRNFQVEYNNIDKNIVNSIPTLSHQYSSQEIEVMFSTVISDPLNARPQINQAMNNLNSISLTTNNEHATRRSNDNQNQDHNNSIGINNEISFQELSSEENNINNNINDNNNTSNNITGRAMRYAKRNNDNKDHSDNEGSLLKKKIKNPFKRDK